MTTATLWVAHVLTTDRTRLLQFWVPDDGAGRDVFAFLQPYGRYGGPSSCYAIGTTAREAITAYVLGYLRDLGRVELLSLSIEPGPVQGESPVRPSTVQLQAEGLAASVLSRARREHALVMRNASAPSWVFERTRTARWVALFTLYSLRRNAAGMARCERQVWRAYGWAVGCWARLRR